MMPIGRFCLHPGKPLGAKRSSSRVSDRRMVLTRFVPSTELRCTDPVSSRSHSCCAAVSVTAALFVWFFCGDHSVIQRAAPAGVRADLMIDAIDRVPYARFGDRRVVQIRPRRNLDRPALVQPHTLEVGEEVDLVLLDRPADRAAELVLLRVGLGQVVLRLEEIRAPADPCCRRTRRRCRGTCSCPT